MKKKPIGYIIAESSYDDLDDKDRKIELKNDGRRVTATVTLQRANSKNRNGRFYDSNILFPALRAPRCRELLRTGWGMENGHPLEQDLTRQQTIEPNNVVAYLLDVWTEGDLVKGKVRGSNLHIGEAFNQDLIDGYIPAWSLRTLGTIEETRRGGEVQNMCIITYDRVYYPSHPEAYTDKIDDIVTESANIFTNNHSNLKTPNPRKNKLLEENGMIIPIMNQQVIDYIKEESNNFKTIKESFEVLYNDIKLINGGTQVQLIDKTGDIFICNLESHIYNEIRRYCNSGF